MKAPAYFPRPLATVAPRDLLLLQSLAVRPTDKVLEIGVGTGTSLLQLAGSAAALHGVDICQGPINRLQKTFGRLKRPFSDIRLFVADFTTPTAGSRLPCRYDLIFSCDTLEHVADPRAFLRNVYASLNHSGRAFITYPNEHPSRAHGITFVERRSTLLDMLTEAGFDPASVRIDALGMARIPDTILRLAWYLPRSFLKRMRRALRPRYAGPQGRPQTFDETDFYHLAGRLERAAPLINAYCWGVLQCMNLAGPVYRLRPAQEVIWDTRILIRAWRGNPTAN
jgi:SAM-dependent methyltransferase